MSNCLLIYIHIIDKCTQNRRIQDILYEFTREEDQSVLISSHIVSDLERICDYIAYIDQGSLKLYEEKDCLFAGLAEGSLGGNEQIQGSRSDHTVANVFRSAQCWCLFSAGKGEQSERVQRIMPVFA